MDTVPVSRFLAGVGIVLNDADRTPTEVINQLADQGFRHVRIEISWSKLQFEDESQINGAKDLELLLQSCQTNRIRPLIVLNGHHGLPVPAIQFDGIVQTDAAAGARAVQISTRGSIVPGFTGLSNLTTYWAAETLIIDVKGQELQLSKPLARPLRTGERIQLATLKYRPFSITSSPEAEETLVGWVRYVETVCRFALQVLGSPGSGDGGFDLEVWNELSMGANFLSINNYYDPPIDSQTPNIIWDKIVARTAEWMTRQGPRLGGIRLSNGFASTIPWPSASAQPSKVSAISKHPYPPLATFPQDEQRNTKALDSFGNPTTWTPSYTAYFPEYFATGIQTETIVRDMGSETSDIYGIKHGRLARSGDAGPVPVWITEIGVNPREAGVSDTVAGELLKTKATARALLFYLNKGSERVYLYCASGKSGGYSLTSPPAPQQFPRAIDIVGRIASVMGKDRPSDLSDPRERLACGFVVHIPDASGLQFAGDGSAHNPPVYNIDMLVLLPFQASKQRIVIAYYFMTRDLRQSTAPETVHVEISGLSSYETSIKTYDPFSDKWENVSGRKLPKRALEVAIVVTDSPRLLLVDLCKIRKPSVKRLDAKINSELESENGTS